MIIEKVFRPDINGLRAVAVILVILFHYGLGPFTGGYVGVDVFFVISGYLITRNILSQCEAGTFSLLEFFKRRIFRLYPAYLAVIMGSFICGMIVFLPEHLERLSKTVLSAVFSISNIYFWREVGYFDLLSDYKPLLHTWSLAVEAQFYLIWPLAIMACLAIFKRRWMFPALLVLGCVVSIAVSQWFLSFSNNVVYYLAPFRMFEFAIGALCVYAPTNWSRHRVVNTLATFVGLGLIVFTAIYYQAETPFPGLNALWPCLGAGLVIVFGRDIYARRALDNPVMNYTGLISYSIYLVHWPVFIFYSYVHFAPLSILERGGVVAVVFAISAAMYHMIEQPFRYGRSERAFGIKNVALIGGFIAIIGAAWGGVVKEGWDGRFDESFAQTTQSLKVERNLYHKVYDGIFPAQEQSDMAFDLKIHKGLPCTFDYAQDITVIKSCVDGHLEQGGQHIVVIGDSNGRDVFEALKAAFPKTNFIMLLHSGCPPAEFLKSPRGGEACFGGLNTFIQETLKGARIKGVVLASRLAEQNYAPVFNTIDILQAQGTDVLMFGPTPMLRHVIENTLYLSGKQLHGETRSLPFQEPYFYASAQKAEDAIVEDLKARAEPYAYYSKITKWCDPQIGCSLYVAEEGEAIFYLDNHHLTHSAIQAWAMQLRDDPVVAGFMP